eukprot:TRINITY_DN15188_c0_g1_i1.p1 TRINITY_DN15188_c0_g1~~TRINITY_DN15188_c0_g1_i1.p1  ORF type:complete len:380 (-),score=64.74 TRINITY_DN15188_c0_g1_i1:208-1347(-)
MVCSEEVKAALLNLEDQDFYETVTAALEARPELAYSIVDFAVPHLTFPPTRSISENRHTGTIKSFVHAKNYGFIHSPLLQEMFGCDVWLHGSQYSGQEMGTVITFAVFLNKEHKPQAFDLIPPKDSAGGAIADWRQNKGMRSVFGSDAAGSDFGSSRGMPHGMQQGMDAMMNVMQSMMPEQPVVRMQGPSGGIRGVVPWDRAPAPAPVNNPDAELGSYFGTVKSFVTKSNYGFIECPDLKAAGYANDVWVHGDQMKDFREPGTQVRFIAFLNPKGQPQAKALQLAAPRRGIDDQDVIGTFPGVIKSFSKMEKGYGFIECPALKEQGYNDVFLHREQLGNFDVGSEVAFTVFLNKKGQPQARDLKPFEAGAKRQRIGFYE